MVCDWTVAARDEDRRRWNEPRRGMKILLMSGYADEITRNQLVKNGLSPSRSRPMRSRLKCVNCWIDNYCARTSAVSTEWEFEPAALLRDGKDVHYTVVHEESRSVQLANDLSHQDCT
jgi:hypothetical protein